MRDKALIPGPRMAITRAARVVAYLTPEEVYRIAHAAKEGRNGERDYLLVRLLFETGLRVSEALSLNPSCLGTFEAKPCLGFVGKGNKPRIVAIPEPLVHRLKSYAYAKGITRGQRFFSINRRRAWQLIKAAADRAGVGKRVYPHLFRHSDAIERLRQTGNPKALQHHLGHSSPVMTMRYLSTLQEEDSLRIQQQVSFPE